jgi:lipopolysaccharide export LptBFGC system permease protein LptF
MILFSFFAMRGAQCKLDFALAGLSHNSNEVLISAESAQSYRELATPLANVLMILFSFFAMRGAKCKLDFALAGLSHNSNEVLISTESAQSYRELATPLANVLMILFSFFCNAWCKMQVRFRPCRAQSQ